MVLEFSGETIEWRGPSPFLFLPIPLEMSEEIRALSKRLTYGWGVIPVTAEIGRTPFTTSLIPRNGVYLLPVKVVVSRAEGIGVGDWVVARIELRSAA